MTKISEILLQSKKPALFICNGINQHKDSSASSWKDLLEKLATDYQLKLSKAEMEEISNTEFFDILDLARPLEERIKLQSKFCNLMHSWRPSEHHKRIVSWARRHRTPIITVNFDENLSKAFESKYIVGERFTDWYPWSSYFSDQKIDDPRTSFAIWHAHGMSRYARSIRLGLRDYMGAVHRARPWIYRGDNALVRAPEKQCDVAWEGRRTWLDILFFCPIMIFGFGFNKDENFLRWLFLERARLHKMKPSWKAEAWFIDTQQNGSMHRKPFFERLGINYVTVSDYADIYEEASWDGQTR